MTNNPPAAIQNLIDGHINGFNAQDGRVARRRSNCEARFAPRGGFDLDTRRKPQAYLAGAVSDAGIMDIECHFLVNKPFL